MNFHKTLMERKLPSALTNLMSGGPNHDFMCSCYLHQAGAHFTDNHNLPFTKRTFKQDLS